MPHPPPPRHTNPSTFTTTPPTAPPPSRLAGGEEGGGDSLLQDQSDTRARARAARNGQPPGRRRVLSRWSLCALPVVLLLTAGRYASTSCGTVCCARVRGRPPRYVAIPEPESIDQPAPPEPPVELDTPPQIRRPPIARRVRHATAQQRRGTLRPHRPYSPPGGAPGSENRSRGNPGRPSVGGTGRSCHDLVASLARRPPRRPPPPPRPFTSPGHARIPVERFTVPI